MRKATNRYMRKNKYGNIRTKYGGINFRSKKEARYAMDLDWRIKAGEVDRWEYEKNPLKLEVNGMLISTYVIDFKVWLSDGTIEYVEVKGAETKDWAIKWRLAQALTDEIIEDNARLVLVK